MFRSCGIPKLFTIDGHIIDLEESFIKESPILTKLLENSDTEIQDLDITKKEIEEILYYHSLEYYTIVPFENYELIKKIEYLGLDKLLRKCFIIIFENNNKLLILLKKYGSIMSQYTDILSRNSSLPLSFVINNPRWNWDYRSIYIYNILYCNEFVRIINSNRDKFNIYGISDRYNMCLPNLYISDMKEVLYHSKVSLSLIKDNINFKWNMCYLSDNDNITPDFIEEHIDWDWDWDKLGSNQNLGEKFITKYRIKISDVILIQNHNTSSDIIENILASSKIQFNSSNNVILMYALLCHPNITLEIVLKFPNINWDYEFFGSKYKIKYEDISSKIPENFINEFKLGYFNNNLCPLSIAEKYIDDTEAIKQICDNKFGTIQIIEEICDQNISKKLIKKYILDYDWGNTRMIQLKHTESLYKPIGLFFIKLIITPMFLIIIFNFATLIQYLYN